MNESVDLPTIADYVSIKEAAKLLGLSSKTVYQYVAEGRIPGVRAGDIILIPMEEVKKYRPNISGRPRKSIPEWRISPEDNQLLSTLILVQLRVGQQEAFMRTLEKIKQGRQHTFPGTVMRYIIGSETVPEQVQILLVWRSTVMPDEAAREQALEEFRQSLAAVVDWNTAQYHSGKVFMHT